VSREERKCKARIPRDTTVCGEGDFRFVGYQTVPTDYSVGYLCGMGGKALGNHDKSQREILTRYLLL
jgi:hypothetical protein